MQTKTIKVPNISCGHCVRAIENEVGELDGVTSVSASESTKLVTIEWNEPQTWETIQALMTEINYPPEN